MYYVLHVPKDVCLPRRKVKRDRPPDQVANSTSHYRRYIRSNSSSDLVLQISPGLFDAPLHITMDCVNPGMLYPNASLSISFS